MFTYVWMKLLERSPRSYDRRMDVFSRGRVHALKEAVAREIPSGSLVLEVGCGTGELAEMLALRGARVDGFDRSPGMVEVARQRVEQLGLAAKIDIRCMGVDGMDGLPDRAYDAVVSTLVLSELAPDERCFAIGHAARALKPDGLLVIADEVVPQSFARRLLQAASRAPAVLLTYLIAGATTRPIPDLAGEVAAAGLQVAKETRMHGGALALIVGRRKSAEGREP